MKKLLFGLIVGIMLLGFPLLAAADHDRHDRDKRHGQRWVENRSGNTVIIYQQSRAHRHHSRGRQLRHELRETRREVRQLKRRLRHKHRHHRHHRVERRSPSRSAVVAGFPTLVFRFDL